jgi:hypothetical protein
LEVDYNEQTENQNKGKSRAEDKIDKIIEKEMEEEEKQRLLEENMNGFILYDTNVKNDGSISKLNLDSYEDIVLVDVREFLSLIHIALSDCLFDDCPLPDDWEDEFYTEAEKQKLEQEKYGKKKLNSEQEKNNKYQNYLRKKKELDKNENISEKNNQSTNESKLQDFQSSPLQHFHSPPSFKNLRTPPILRYSQPPSFDELVTSTSSLFSSTLSPTSESSPLRSDNKSLPSSPL